MHSCKPDIMYGFVSAFYLAPRLPTAVRDASNIEHGLGCVCNWVDNDGNNVVSFPCVRVEHAFVDLFLQSINEQDVSYHEAALQTTQV